MQAYLECDIYFDTIKKTWKVNYKGENAEFSTINELLTFLGKKCVILQTSKEFEYKAPTEELQKMFS